VQVLPTGGPAVHGWPTRADPYVQERKVIVANTVTSVNRCRHPAEPAAVHSVSGRDRRGCGKNFLAGVQTCEVQECGDLVAELTTRTSLAYWQMAQPRCLCGMRGLAATPACALGLSQSSHKLPGTARNSASVPDAEWTLTCGFGLRRTGWTRCTDLQIR
jgi:hypothetical protein